MQIPVMIEARGLAKSFGSVQALAGLDLSVRVAAHDFVADGAAVRQRIGMVGQYAVVDLCLTGRANPVMIGRLRWALSDVQVTTWRIATTPGQQLNVTVQPLIFVLLFSYVFTGAIILPDHDSYRDYLIALWSVALLSTMAPFAAWLYARRTRR